MGILNARDAEGGFQIRWERIQGRDPPTPQQHPISGHTHKHVMLGEEVEINLTVNRSIW